MKKIILLALIANVLCVFGLIAVTKQEIDIVANQVADAIFFDKTAEGKDKAMDEAKKALRGVHKNLAVYFDIDKRNIAKFQMEYQRRDGGFIDEFREAYENQLRKLTEDGDKTKLKLNRLIHFELFKVTMEETAKTTEFTNFYKKLNEAPELQVHKDDIKIFQKELVRPFGIGERAGIKARVFSPLGKKKTLLDLALIAAISMPVGAFIQERLERTGLKGFQYKGIGSRILGFSRELPDEEVDKEVAKLREFKGYSRARTIALLHERYSWKNIRKILFKFYGFTPVTAPKAASSPIN